MNVNVAGETVTSLVSADVAEITTSDVGCAANTTVKVPVVPASETVAVVAERVIPAGVSPPPDVANTLPEVSNVAIQASHSHWPP